MQTVKIAEAQSRCAAGQLLFKEGIYIELKGY